MEVLIVDWGKVRGITPMLSGFKPSGKYVMEELRAMWGVAEGPGGVDGGGGGGGGGGPRGGGGGGGGGGAVGGVADGNFALPSFSRALTKNGAAGGPIELLKDVDLNVKIELGRTRMLIEDVLRLAEGSVVELDKLAGDPVDVYVNDQLV